jgi:hypothetical protein
MRGSVLVVRIFLVRREAVWQTWPRLADLFPTMCFVTGSARKVSMFRYESWRPACRGAVVCHVCRRVRQRCEEARSECKSMKSVMKSRGKFGSISPPHLGANSIGREEGRAEEVLKLSFLMKLEMAIGAPVVLWELVRAS